ncbi:hypothetical protein CGRA01v4_05596 [Colletotrichum graminicola]|nr:hypothetical protein CGRA01v4_05596 [Colletotrichum graminicola]
MTARIPSPPLFSSLPSPRFLIQPTYMSRADGLRNPRAETEKTRKQKPSTPCRASPWLFPLTLAPPDPGIISDGR